jgi:hypothetical protein
VIHPLRRYKWEVTSRFLQGVANTVQAARIRRITALSIDAFFNTLIRQDRSKRRVGIVTKKEESF